MYKLNISVSQNWGSPQFINMETTVEIARRGQITIPKALRVKLGIEEGSKYGIRTVTGGILVLTPLPGQANSARKQLQAALEGKGATLDSMLADLRSLRESNDE